MFFFYSKERTINEKRKDNKNRVLKKGEYQRPNGSYVYKLKLKNGKLHSIYAPTLNELREKVEQLQKDMLLGIEVGNNKLTVNDFYERWVQLKRGLKQNTFDSYKYIYQKYIADTFGNKKIRDVKRSDVRGFYNDLYDSGKMKPSTINNLNSVLHQVFDLALEDEYIRYNPSNNALRELKRAHSGESEKKKGLTRQQQENFETFLATDKRYNRMQPLFTVMFWTGMRIGEVTGLRWGDVDFEKNEIKVNRTLVYCNNDELGKSIYSINTPKTEAGRRTIPMAPQVKEAFLQEKRFQVELGLKCLSVVDGYSDFVFVNQRGTLLRANLVNRTLKRIVELYNDEAEEK